MIYDYEISKKNNEEILYLYLNFDTEFSRLKAKDKKKKINQIVKDFIKENRIKFNGQKVAIIIGGILVTTLVITNTGIKETESTVNDTGYNYSLNLKSDIFSNEIKPVANDEEKQIIKEETEEDVAINVAKVEKKTTAAEKKVTKKAVVNKRVNSSSNTQENKNEPSQNAKEETQPKVEPVDTNTYVTIKRTNGNYEKIELEEYIIGVVGAEMPAAFNIEALKAQAVIARTYTLKAIETGKQLTDNSSTQNYKNNEELKKVWGISFNTYYSKIKNAVMSTKGLYLTYNGEIIEAPYHSTSNGQTEDARYVWGNAFPYLVSVYSKYDNLNPTFEKSTFISYSDLSAKLKMSIDKDTNINIMDMTAGNRIATILINEQSFTGVFIRNTLGLRSADFAIQREETGLTFTTRGYGHGVGLSQYGANGMAKNGSTYEQILKHYYQGVKLTKM